MQLDASCEGAEKPAAAASAELARTDFKEEREELERVLQHPDISRSQSLVRFLSFICNKYFDGEADDIREYTIAVEALGRRESSFDSHIDPIVRVTARSLRKKLWNLYQNDGKDHPLHIVLPLGHYVPQFVRPQEMGGQLSAPPDEVPLEAAETEAVAAREEAEASQKISANFLGRHRRLLLQCVLALLIVPLIFLSGYFFGRHTEKSTESVAQGFKWGEPVWSDEFDGTAGQLPDAAKWTFDTGGAPLWGNNEVETYCSPRGDANPRGCDAHRPNAFEDGAGHLVLRAQRNADGSWTSARITTRGLQNFQYGRIEARMKLPVGTGLWPYFWMLGANFGTVGWPASGSATIVESVSDTARSNALGPGMIRSTVHGPQYYGANGLWHNYKLPNGARVDDSGFHTYGVIWSPGMMQFYVDDPANIYRVLNAGDLPEGAEWVFDHPFYLIMNLALGGDWPGNPDATTPNPSDILVDYVRVYKIPAISAPAIQWQPIPVKAGSSVASIVTLRAQSYAGRVHLTCSTEPATTACSLATSVVDFSDTLSQEDSLTVSTDFFTDKGRNIAPPGRYKMTITATTISGDRSQLTVPFEVKNTD